MSNPFFRGGSAALPATGARLGRRGSGCLRSYALLAPATLLFVVFMFYPLAYTFYLSFFDWNMTRPTKEFVALDNYIAVLTDPNFGRILGNTALYILLLLLFDFAAPYVFSFLLSFVVRKGKQFYKGAIFLPSVVSLVVGTMIFVWLLNPISGPVAVLAKGLGLTVPIWSNTQGLVIVVPMSSATGIYVLILSIVTGMQQIFTPINMITKGGPDNASTNLIYAVYDQAFGYFKTGTASAYAILMMLLFGFLLFLEFRFVERSVYYEN